MTGLVSNGILATNMKNRIPWIDIARGLGIIFVIYAHTLDKNSIRFIFYAFHMPLFFFLSGIVHNHKKTESFFIFIKKNIKRIIIPYILFALITYAWWIITQNNGLPSMMEFKNHIIGIIYGSGAVNGLFFNTILWFLPCLFIAKVLFETVSRLTNNTFLQIIILGILALSGYLYSIIFPNIKLPFQAETAITAAVFVGAGYLFYKYFHLLNTFLLKNNFKIFIISFFLLLISAIMNYLIFGLQNDMRLNRLNNIFLFYISTFSGILTTIIFSMTLNKNNLLEFFGKISIFLFVFHPLFFYHFKKITLVFFEKPINNPMNNIFLAPIYTIFAIIFISVLYFLLNYFKAKILLTNQNESS